MSRGNLVKQLVEGNIMQSTQQQIVVGNRFKHFAAHSEVTTITDMLGMLRQEPNSLHQVSYTLGQGLSSAERRLLLRLEKMQRIGKLEHANITAAPKHMTHKHHAKNSMVSVPKQITQKDDVQYYKLNLLIDDACAEMHDHVTGQHVQGMVLVEAARQAMLAVSEQYYLTEEQQGTTYCVLNNIRTQFKRFAFPVHTEIHLYVDKKSIAKNGRVSLDTRIIFMQQQQEISEICIDCFFENRDLMVHCEERLARRRLNSLIRAA